MSDFQMDQYEDYLVDFQAWGHTFFDKPLAIEEFETISAEYEGLQDEEECSQLAKRQRKRKDELERLLLTHESYFVNGPRTVLVFGSSRR